MKLPIISLAILGGQIAMAAGAGGGDVGVALDNFSSYYTGFSFRNRVFTPQNLVIGYAPWLVKRFVVPIVQPGRSLSRMHLPISLS